MELIPEFLSKIYPHDEGRMIMLAHIRPVFVAAAFKSPLTGGTYLGSGKGFIDV